MNARPVEDAVLAIIREYVLTDDFLQSVVAFGRSLDRSTPCIEDQQIGELERKLEKGTEKLALADGENFRAISDLVNKWRDQAEQLRRQRDRKLAAMGSSDQTVALLERVGSIRDKLHLMERYALGCALTHVVSKVEVRREDIDGKRIIRGTVQLDSMQGFPFDPIPFEYDEKAAATRDRARPPQSGDAVARFVADRPAGCTIREYAEAHSMTPQNAHYQFLLALQAGSIRRARRSKPQLYIAAARGASDD